MGETEYSEALKLGKKEYRARIAKGQFPYLPVLDEILSEADIQTEQNMGLVQVPLDFVVGTSTMGRTYSFAANFMPILDWETEFAVKWSNLSDAQMNEGIRDPIKAFEYMNRYYVLEGNKRVSVLKYFNAVSIPAIVTRKIPKLSDDYDVRLYYEYMKFNEITGLCSVEFTKLGNADKLLSLVGKEGRWDDETKEKFAKVMFDFQRSIISAVVTGWTLSWVMLLQYLWRSLAWMPCLRCLRMITTKTSSIHGRSLQQKGKSTR